MSIILALPAAMVAATAAATAVAASPATEVGANLERFAYPYPVRWYAAAADRRMAYMDVAPDGAANGRTLVLLHGKNFCAATWGDTARRLSAAGYRVIVPDQIGFCKSSKPAGFQYSFAALATMTRDLLAQAGVTGPVTMVGHSTGGILAVHYALLYPKGVVSVMLVNPLGLNDTLAEGVPYAPLATLCAEEAKTDAASIRAYQLKTYYHGTWRPGYDRWVAMLAGQYASAGGDAVREAQARLSDMIETQPVAAELSRVAVPVTLLIGDRDTTAFRGASAPEGTRVRTVPEAARDVAARLPDYRLVTLTGLGHAPQVEDQQRFGAALLAALGRWRSGCRRC